MNNYQRIQNALIEVITDTHHGKINPLLLSPEQLRAEISSMKDHLPAGLKLPGHHSTTDLLQIYQLMTIQGRRAQNHLIFKLTVPLLTDEPFEMFRVIPVPIPVNGSYMAIKPTTTVLVTNFHRDLYYPMSEMDLRACARVQAGSFLCKQRHPIYIKDTNNTHCELSLLTHLPPPSTCKVEITNKEAAWIQLFNPNHWIYSMKGPTTTNIVCGSNITHKVLKGVGLLKIHGNCVIKQNSVIINSHNIYPAQIRASFAPSINISNYIIPPHIKHPATSGLDSIDISNITALQNEIETFKIQQNLPKILEAEDIHQFVIGYVALGLILILIAYITWATLMNRLREQPRPPIAQRRIATPKTTKPTSTGATPKFMLTTVTTEDNLV